MSRARRWQLKFKRSAAFALIAGFVLLAGSLGTLLPSYSQSAQPVQHITIPLNKSVTIPLPQSFSSAVVGSPEIADAVPMSDRTLYIQAKKIGTTNVSIYDENMRVIKIVDVEVGFDTGNLQAKIRASTGNTGIRVSN